MIIGNSDEVVIRIAATEAEQHATTWRGALPYDGTRHQAGG